MIERIFTSCRSVWARAEGVDDEFGEIYRAGARLRAVRAVAGPSRGTPAVYARARSQSASGRRRGFGRRTARSGGREPSPGGDGGRSRPRQIAQGRRVGGRPALYGADDGAHVR